MKAVAHTRALALSAARAFAPRAVRVYPTGKGWVAEPLSTKNAGKGKLRGVTVRFK